jgi:hypothetical protein
MAPSRARACNTYKTVAHGWALPPTNGDRLPLGLSGMPKSTVFFVSETKEGRMRRRVTERARQSARQSGALGSVASRNETAQQSYEGLSHPSFAWMKQRENFLAANRMRPYALRRAAGAVGRRPTVVCVELSPVKEGRGLCLVGAPERAG